MRIGFDIDGVLANFARAYQHLVVEVSGVDLFQPGDIDYPPCWNWPEFRGYSKDIMDFKEGPVWNRIRRDDTFWMNLEPFVDNVSALKAVIRDLEHRHEVYFVTSRDGVRPKWQTKMWLIDQLNYLGRAHCEPTVLLTSQKGEAAHALKLDAYIDDNYDNIMSVVKQSPATRAYLLNRSYNLYGEPGAFTRVGSLGSMLDVEISANNL